MNRTITYLLPFSFLILFGVYLYHAAPTITIGDSGELAAVGGTLGIAHSPGYPLYSMLSRLGCQLIPFGGTAYRTNLLSAFWTAASVLMIVLTLGELLGNWHIALVAAVVGGAVPIWMGQAVVTEVFGLNSFMAAFLLWIALRPPTRASACLGAYILGVGLGNNHTLILLTPALILAFWPLLRERPGALIAELAVFTALGLSIYAFVPLRAHRLPFMDWEEPATWERFWKLFTRARYGSLQLAQGSVAPVSWDDIVDQTSYVGQTLWLNYGIWCATLGLGVLAGLRAALRKPTLVLLTAFLFSGPLFLIWTHLTVTAHTRGLLERFLYLPLVPAILLLGIGLEALLRLLKSSKLPEVYALALIGLGSLAWAYAQPIPFERDNFYVRDLGLSLLHNAPPHTLLFSDRADEAEFALAYLQRVENLRPDIQFIDCNAGVSRSIYGPNYYDVWGRPRLATRMEEERRQIALWNGPVYYATHDPQMIPIPRIQEGLLFRVATPGARPRSFPWPEILVFRHLSPVSAHPLGWDRGMYRDYLSLLTRDAFEAHDFQHGIALYRGADLYGKF